MENDLINDVTENDSVDDNMGNENIIEEEIIQEVNIHETNKDEEVFEEQYINKRKRSDEERTEESMNKKKKLIKKMVEQLNSGITEEENMDNRYRITTEQLVEQVKEIEGITELTRRSDELEKLKLYNYAESFQFRIGEEIRMDQSKNNRTASTKIYQEMMIIMGIPEGDNHGLRKRTQRAEKLYKLVKKAGGKEKLRLLEGISITAIIKLTKKEIEYAIRKIKFKKNISMNE